MISFYALSLIRKKLGRNGWGCLTLVLDIDWQRNLQFQFKHLKYNIQDLFLHDFVKSEERNIKFVLLLLSLLRLNL